MQSFIRGHCGLVDEANTCRCGRRVGAAIGHGRLDPDDLLFARGVRDGMRRMDRLHDAAAVFRSHPELRAPDRIVAVILRAMPDLDGGS